MVDLATRAALPTRRAPRGRCARRLDAPLILAGLLLSAFAVNRWGVALVRSHHVMKVAYPPLHAVHDPRFGRSALPVIVLAVAVLAIIPELTTRLSWRALMWSSAALSALWTIALNATDGWDGLLRGIDNRNEYLADVRHVGSPLTFLHGFTDHLSQYATHTRGHPPGFVLVLWILDVIGLGGARWAAALCIAAGALAVPAVLIATRDVAGEGFARAAMPFVGIAPVALWVGTSADACFAGLGAISVGLIVRSIVRTDRVGLALLGGFGFGALLLCSYGLALLAIVPGAVAWQHRRLAALVPAVLGAGAVLGVAYVAGFNYLSGIQATRAAYGRGVASMRPYSYALVADLVVFALLVGPAVVVGCARLRDRRAWMLVGGALLAVLLADLSGMSKLEVERIWLPFAFWVLPAAASVTLSARATMVRRWMAIQMALAIGLQVTLRTGW